MSVPIRSSQTWSRYHPDNIFPIIYNGDQLASNSHGNSPVYPNIEFDYDFMATLIACKSYEDLMKNEIAIVCRTFSEVYGIL